MDSVVFLTKTTLYLPATASTLFTSCTTALFQITVFKLATTPPKNSEYRQPHSAMSPFVFYFQATALGINPFLVAAVPLLILVCLTLHSYIRLAHISGPFFAQFTNLSRFSWVLSNNAHDIHVNLHRRYGPLVRFGPNMVSVGDPREIGKIYGFANPWLKVSWRVTLFHSSGSVRWSSFRIGETGQSSSEVCKAGRN